MPPVDSVTPYRTTATEVVLGCSMGPHQLYFKGLASDRASEALFTSRLATVAPESFARTVALERRRDESVWWLTDACPGLSFARCPSIEGARCVAAACAELQRRTMTSGDVCDLPNANLSKAAASIAELVDDRFDNARSCRTAIEEACDRVVRAGLTQAWIPLDLDPENVLVDAGGAVRFIDLDDSHVGPAPLAIATFARRLERMAVGASASPELADVVRRGYERAWPESVAGCDWRALDIAAAVLEADLGWKRVIKNIERGELAGPLDRVRGRIAQRLTRATAPRSDPSVKTAPQQVGAALGNPTVERR